jgi:Kef-type K+ transport system membrane component KefB
MGIFTLRLGMPALVGEIVTGFLLGPPLADFVPFPEAMVLVGEIGLIMLLLEAGVELDIAQLKETGTRAVAIGVTGTILPLLVGVGLASTTGASIKSAMAVGASFSPTSLGVAASALKAGKMIDTPVGQLIVAACVIDDILALILLSMFQVLVMDSPPIIQYFIPIISSLGFLVVLGGSAVTWMPKFIENKILHRFSEGNKKLVMFTLMTFLMMAYLPLLNYTKASYLTGAFLAGCTFSQVEHAHHQFMEKTHQLMTWLLRVFFAASIGFQVPVSHFGDPYVIGWGFILYLCVLAKLPLAFYVPRFEDSKSDKYNPFLRDRLITGLSMTCRGEFSFIIAAFALGEGLFNAKIYAAIVFAVLLSCITSPFMLLNMIKYFNTKQAEYFASTNPHKLNKGSNGSIPLYLHIKVKSAATMGLQEQFCKIMNDLGLEIVERRTNRQGRGLDATVQTDLFVQDSKMTTKVQKIKAQRHIKKALAQIQAEVTSAPQNSFYRSGSVRFSSNNLSSLDLKSLADDDQKVLMDAAAQEDSIIKRGNEVKKAVKEAIGGGAEVVVDVWNPWPWTGVLETIAKHYDLEPTRTADTLETFARIFDTIDADRGGSVDMGEMYEALQDAGMDITEEGINTLFGIIDEDGNGELQQLTFVYISSIETSISWTLYLKAMLIVTSGTRLLISTLN